MQSIDKIPYLWLLNLATAAKNYHAMIGDFSEIANQPEPSGKDNRRGTPEERAEARREADRENIENIKIIGRGYETSDKPIRQDPDRERKPQL